MKKYLYCLMAGMLAVGGEMANAQVSLPPGVQDVVKLKQAGMGDDVILTQIRNNGAFYNLSADQIIYLKDQDVSQPVIRALMGNGGGGTSTVPATPVPTAIPATPAPTIPSPGMVPPPGTVPPPGVVPPPGTVPAPGGMLGTFQSQLNPYGSWMQVPGYGLCWQPTVAVTDPGWQPYATAGHWVYGDSGWLWQSDYPWGDVAFHYGRWHRGVTGWIWVPGYDWGPAWVTWRQSEGYLGWAPLPPEAVFHAGVGLYYRDQLAVDADFGLEFNAFTFVPYDHFWDHDLRLFFVPHDRVRVIFGESHIMNGYRFDHGRFIVEGPGHDRIIGWTHHDGRGVEVIRDPRGREMIDRRGGRDDRRDIH